MCTSTTAKGQGSRVKVHLQGVSEVGGDEGVAWPSMAEEEEVEVEECQVEEGRYSQQVHAPQQRMLEQDKLEEEREKVGKGREKFN